MSEHRWFDRSRIRLESLQLRGSDLRAEHCLPLAPPAAPYDHVEFPQLVQSIRRARDQNRPVVLMMGAHPIKLGLSRFLIDLVNSGYITHLAMNGAALVHDFELALCGETSEDVARWIAVGQFGLWRETSRLNDVIAQAGAEQQGLATAVGQAIEAQQFTYRSLSLVAAAVRHGIPATCHVTIGADILHAMPNCDAAAVGVTSYQDFLSFADSVERLQDGVYLNLGSAVTGPEVFLKALSMARNVARQHGQTIQGFTTAVFDLVPLPDSFREGPPDKQHPLYYFRPWKTLLCRTVAGGGSSYYFCGDHRVTVPTLWSALVCQAGGPAAGG